MTQISSFVIPILYAAVSRLALFALGCLAPFNRRLRLQLRGRPDAAAIATDLTAERNRYAHCVLFFCSSAGEYEQARPLIDRVAARQDTYAHVLFFSRSGLEFLRARGDKVPACLIPPTDSPDSWGWIMSAARPTMSVIIRHEIWPGFTWSAGQFGKLHLANAGRSAGEKASWIKRRLRRWLLRRFDRIYAISDQDRDWLVRQYGLDAQKVLVTGDTKFDRARDRAVVPAGGRQALESRLGALLDGGRRRLVIGSAHSPDLEVVLAARRQLGSQAGGWLIVVVPHHVDSTNIQRMRERCEAEGLKTGLYSAAGNESGTSAVDMIIVDAMGLLAEIYGLAAAAFVGGAMHHQVHNVLEPAGHGLPLAFGPKYKNSAEAVILADSGLARVVTDASALAAWWQGLNSDLSAHRQTVRRAVDDLCGASARIADDWQRILGPPGTH